MEIPNFPWNTQIVDSNSILVVEGGMWKEGENRYRGPGPRSALPCSPAFVDDEWKKQRKQKLGIDDNRETEYCFPRR